MNNIQNCMIDYPNFPSYPDYSNYEIKKIKRTTRTIEKYNKKGKLVGKEVITEEEEIVDVPLWVTSPDWISTDGTGFLPNIDNDNHTIQLNKYAFCPG